ncbi:TPA: pathogenicity island protein [Staphylococcus pseudintermedius]|nr:pathogenicity island protein [Staphylococcus pseudintermedius]MCE5640425.1 pathogenicity island protein [Staphylococcus pseudintermedius]HDT9061750.1 pathogenicity island protein [Staphylococcus pseudintermedius]
MKEQVVIHRTLVGWFNVKSIDGTLLFNVAPDILENAFPEINTDTYIACMELDLSRITEIKNKKKVGS